MYFANPSTAAIRSAMARGHLGAMMTGPQGNRLPAGTLFAVDNGCGPGRDGHPGTGYRGDGHYLGLLQGLAEAGHPEPCDPDGDWCLFAVAPDVVGDAEATLARSAHMLGWIRHIGYRVALAAQNGLERLTVPWDDFDVLFLGGDTCWKLGPAARQLTAEARRRGKDVHMGRVNSLRRLRYASAIGCTSADGTYFAHGPDVNLPRLLGWLRDVNGQGVLWAS